MIAGMVVPWAGLAPDSPAYKAGASLPMLPAALVLRRGVEPRSASYETAASPSMLPEQLHRAGRYSGYPEGAKDVFKSDIAAGLGLLGRSPRMHEPNNAPIAFCVSAFHAAGAGAILA